jgi:hypothetical protein
MSGEIYGFIEGYTVLIKSCHLIRAMSSYEEN